MDRNRKKARPDHRPGKGENVQHHVTGVLRTKTNIAYHNFYQHFMAPPNSEIQSAMYLPKIGYKWIQKLDFINTRQSLTHHS